MNRVSPSGVPETTLLTCVAIESPNFPSSFPTESPNLPSSLHNESPKHKPDSCASSNQHGSSSEACALRNHAGTLSEACASDKHEGSLVGFYMKSTQCNSTYQDTVESYLGSTKCNNTYQDAVESYTEAPWTVVMNSKNSKL